MHRNCQKWNISFIFLILFSMPSTAFAWPTDEQWHVVVNQTGNFSDPFDDYGGKEDVEIVGNDTYPVSYIFNDGTDLYFRMRILDDPVFNGNYFINKHVWGVEFDTDGNTSNYEYILYIKGGNNVDAIYLHKNTHAGENMTASDAPDVTPLWSVVVGNNNWTYFRAVDAPDVFGTTNNTFVDWRIPFDIFLNLTNLTNESQMRLVFGTSIQNDYIDADISNTALDSDNAYVSDVVSEPYLTIGTKTTNGSVKFVADMNGSGNVTDIIVYDTVYVRIDDVDRNSDPISYQSASVTLLSSNGDNETIVLTETGNDTGVFTGSISTADTSVTVGDNILQVVELGTFNVTYMDTTAEGLYANRNDTANVTDTTPPASVTSLTNVTYNETFINWTWTDPTDFDFDHVEVWIDSIFIVNVSNGTQFYNATGLIPNTQHNISTRTVDIRSNINQTWVNHSAWTDRDIILPLINFTAPTPLDNSYLIQDYIPVNVTAFDKNLKNITIYLYYGNGTLIDNVTNISSPVFNNFTGLLDSTYIINATAYDTGENSASTGNRTIILDTTPPSIGFVSPTPANNSNLSHTQIDFNYSAIDNNLENVTIYLYYSNGTLMSNTTYFTLQNWGFFSGLSDGTYLLNATVYDKVGYFNKSETLSITLDTNPPNITFESPTPPDNVNLTIDYIQTNATASDSYLKNITIYIYYDNGTLLNNITNTSSPTLNNFTGLLDNIYIINATAYDWAGNFNKTGSRTIIVDGTPPIINFANTTPANNSNLSQDYIPVNITVFDINLKNVTNYLYYENGTEVNNITVTSSSNNVLFIGLSEGIYYINATAFDWSGYSNTTQTRTIVLDSTSPDIYFTSPTPANNSIHFGNNITVNVTATDLNLKNITTFLYYTNGTPVTNITNTSSPAVNNFTALSPGVYLINATAYDWAGNYNTSKTRNITLLGPGSDLNLTSGNIIFVYDGVDASKVTETGEIKENVNLTINATIYNKGASDSGNFYVLFYESSSEFYNVSMNSIAAGASANATAYWTTISGTHNITIKADPHGNTLDTDTSNNNASGTINVSAWQKYNGNVSGRVVLNNSASDVMLKWTWSNATDIGNLYAVNKSAGINWSELYPLGYDSDNSPNASGGDFLDADINLGMITGYGNATGFAGNNISELFTNTSGNNYGNVSIDRTSFTVNGQVIYNVPIVNSTDMTDHTNLSNANFITGILWDGTKDTNGYYDTGDNEKLVFIAIVKNAAVGADGKISNYEISIPCNLNPVTGGDLDFYLELR